MEITKQDEVKPDGKIGARSFRQSLAASLTDSCSSISLSERNRKIEALFLNENDGIAFNAAMRTSG